MLRFTFTKVPPFNNGNIVKFLFMLVRSINSACLLGSILKQREIHFCVPHSLIHPHCVSLTQALSKTRRWPNMVSTLAHAEEAHTVKSSRGIVSPWTSRMWLACKKWPPHKNITCVLKLCSSRAHRLHTKLCLNELFRAIMALQSVIQNSLVSLDRFWSNQHKLQREPLVYIKTCHEPTDALLFSVIPLP